VDVNLGLHWYPEYFEAVTGIPLSWEGPCMIGERINNLMRAFWTRENRNFNRAWDYPPDRWFEEPLSQGKLKGEKLDRVKYDQMLSWFYELQGWDQNGIPLKETLDRLGLKDVSKEIMK
jgi:aldehyde:ferredoxin oxidoreductase